MFYFKTPNLIMSLIYWGMKVFYQGSGLHEFAFIFIFVIPQKVDFFIIALASVEKLVSVEDAPSASLREGKHISSHVFGFRLMEPSFLWA